MYRHAGHAFLVNKDNKSYLFGYFVHFQFPQNVSPPRTGRTKLKGKTLPSRAYTRDPSGLSSGRPYFSLGGPALVGGWDGTYKMSFDVSRAYAHIWGEGRYLNCWRDLCVYVIWGAFRF